MTRNVRNHPLVKYGLVNEADMRHLLDCMHRNDAEALIEYAIPLCEDNVPLFSVIFMGLDVNVPMCKEWRRIMKAKRMLIRMSRGFGKTLVWTTAVLVHRICYAARPGSKWADPRVLAIFGSRDRVRDRMGAVMQLIESGGPGGLIGLAFHGPGGMDLVEYYKTHGSWGDFMIDCPHPDGKFKQDAVIRALAPGMDTVGFHPRLILMDDLVGTKQAESELKRKKLVTWFDQDVSPMLKSHVYCYVPHTVFHEEDLNNVLASRGEFFLLEIPALNRMPSFRDFRDIEDSEGNFLGVELTAEGESLQSTWPCPSGPERDCPASEEHYAEVGFHRPVRDLLVAFRRNPRSFAQQYMHTINRMDDCVIKPWMLRFYTNDPTDRRIGKTAPHHADWSEWVDKHGLANEPPAIQPFPEASSITHAVHGWDFAYGKQKRHDQTACAKLYREGGGKVFAAFDAGRWGHDQVIKKVIFTAITDPVTKPSVIGIESGGAQSVMVSEIRKQAVKLNVTDSFAIKEVYRTADKDKMFVESGLANLMANGKFYVDIDDEDTINELLSVMQDQSGGHDDRLDSAVNGYRFIRQGGTLTPGFL